MFDHHTRPTTATVEYVESNYEIQERFILTLSEPMN